MTLREVYRLARSMPFEVVLRKAIHLGGKRIKGYVFETRDRLISSRIDPAKLAGKKPTQLFCTPVPASLIRSSFPHLDEYVCQIIEHKFDLLGSGLQRVSGDAFYPGMNGHRYDEGRGAKSKVDGERWIEKFINKANVDSSCSAWRLLSDGYSPIDWHVDFRSGYRWSPSTPYQKVPFGHRPGVDIKVPWELARMQHLPMLALAYAVAQNQERDKERAPQSRELPFDGDTVANELRNQIVDFIAMNPPRFGVNWRCPMDVAVRAANWILAVDLFRANGYEFDTAFYELLLASLMDHGRFVFRNFERSSDFRGSHFLADVAGLSFIAAALPKSEESDRWLKFCSTTLIEECAFQFHPDGTNFEGSSYYHFFSAETLIYSLLMILSLPAERKVKGVAGLQEVPAFVWQRILGMKRFAIALSKPGHRIVQVGDCDNSRFFKVQPALHKQDGVLTESHLDHRHLIGLIDGIFGSKSLPDGEASGGALDRFLAEAFSARIPGLRRALDSVSPTGVTATGVSVAEVKILEEFSRIFDRASDRSKRTYRFTRTSGGGEVELNAFPDFGLYIFRGDDFFLSVRCGSVGQQGRGGHDHNDQLSIELEIDGQLLIADPGTFVYTSVPDLRNRYRSIQAHFAPRVAGEEGVALGAMFFIGNAAAGLAKVVAPRSFLGEVSRGGKRFERLITIGPNEIEVRDLVHGDHELEDLICASRLPFSPGYGLRELT